MIKTTFAAAILASTANNIQIMPGEKMLAQREQAKTDLAQISILESLYDKFTTVFGESSNGGQIFSDEVEEEFKQYSQLHAEYEGFKQEEMPELSQTDSETEQFQLGDAFITNIKVQVPTPASLLCGGRNPVFVEIEIKSKSSQSKSSQSKSGKGKITKIRKAKRPLKSCGSKSFSSKESDFVKQGTPSSFLSYVAYDTNCESIIVDILIDMQNPISSLTPWVFSQIGNTKNYIIGAGDKKGACNNIYLNAPNCSKANFLNVVGLTNLQNDAVTKQMTWSFVFDATLQAYYVKTTQTCNQAMQWLKYDPNIGDNGYFRLATQADRSAFLLPPAQQIKGIAQ